MGIYNLLADLLHYNMKFKINNFEKIHIYS